jgi:predicted metalloprotease with PDZ domain
MIRYQVGVQDAAAHLFGVTVVVPTQPNTPVQFDFAAWIPGSYLLREFAKHIVGAIDCVELHPNGRFKKRALTQTDKNTWTITPTTHALQLRYTVYAWDFSVRAAHLDQSHAFFNCTSLCMRVATQPDSAVELSITPPNDHWKVATTLPKVKTNKQGFGTYRADSFDDLIDYPVEMGNFVQINFTAQNVPHRAVFTGVALFDQQRLASDLAKICAEQIRFFEPRSKLAPFDQYLFMTQVSAEGYGGLEHRNSTALHCARNDLPSHGMGINPSVGYRQYLGLCSHEYFHAWNVKRIKPAAFAPYDLARENYTSLLWIFEGFTSYYDDLFLLRSGVISKNDYFDLLAQTITRVLSEPGRFKQSIAQSSFDAWTKYYRQDENSSNSLISYYTKGSLVALCLDITIRTQTRGAKSLDDVMRLLWQRAKQGIYLGENDFASWVRDATGCNLNNQIRRWAYLPGDLPLQELLEQAGVSWQSNLEPHPSLGLKLVQRGPDLVAAGVAHGGVGHKAGVSANDIIVAADGLRMNDKAIKSLLMRKKAGDRLTLTLFRRDELKTMSLVLGAPALASIKLSQR